MDMYEELIKKASDLKTVEEETSGMDDFIGGVKAHEPLPNKIKVASLGDLSDFFRVSHDTLVHKAEKDLWKISEDEKGQVIIERLFDPQLNTPVKV